VTAANVLAHGISHRFGTRAALDDVSLRAQGGVTTLLGPNGAGKTTLLRALASSLAVDEGQILVDGLDLGREPDRTEVRRRLGYLPQEPAFAPSVTVFDVIDYLAILKEHHDRRPRHVEVRRVLAEVGLTARSGDRVSTLSTGMRRRLGLAQALIGRPGLLLLDEPAVGLDPEERLGLRERIANLGADATVVLSTHLTDEAAAMSSTVLVLDEGRIRFTGSPAQLRAEARGRVWVGELHDPGALMSWRLPDGRYRSLGSPPPDAMVAEPTIEDAYLLLVGRRALV
jgi:ABC-2 type transport system ATP-binding protein